MGDRSHLTPAQRAQIAGIIARHPKASNGQVARIFAAKYGRKIGVSAVRRVRLGHVPSGHYLTPDQRETLRRLIRDSAPEYFRFEVVELFTMATGRAIGRSTVSTEMQRMGIPPAFGSPAGGPGRSGRGRADRQDKIRAAKIARVSNSNLRERALIK